MAWPSRKLLAVFVLGLCLAACNAIWGIDQPISAEGGPPDATSERTVVDAHEAGRDAATDVARDAHHGEASSDASRDAGGDASLYFTGACAEGGTVIAIATHQPGPRFIASDEAGVYWTTSSGLSILKFGSETTYHATEGGVVSQGVGVSDGRLAWGAFDAVLTCVAPDCPTVFPVTSTANYPVVVVDNATTVFWTTDTFGVNSCSIVPPASPIAITNSGMTGGLALDDTYVYWSDDNTTIYSCLLTGCGEHPQVVAQPDTPNELLVHAGVLFWSGPGSIGECPLHDGTCGFTGTFVGDISPHGLAADDEHLYWVDSNGFIARVSLDGGAPEGGAAIKTLYDSPNLSDYLTVGDTCVFWTETDTSQMDGSVMAGPK
jgi:hypothetical protein